LVATDIKDVLSVTDEYDVSNSFFSRVALYVPVSCVHRESKGFPASPLNHQELVIVLWYVDRNASLLLVVLSNYNFYVAVPLDFGTKACRINLTSRFRVLKILHFGAKIKLHLLNTCPERDTYKAQAGKKKPFNKKSNLKEYVSVATVIRNSSPSSERAPFPDNTSEETPSSVDTISLT
jgi:hypothetical protein